MKYPYVSLEHAQQIPEDQKVIFLWMPKCAGVSIHENLAVCYGETYGHYNKQGPFVLDSSLRCVTFYHSHVPALVEAGFVPSEWAQQAFKFAFGRNSWDRMVSLYHYLIAMKYHRLPATFEEFLQQVVAGDYPRPEARNLLGHYQANNLLAWLRPNGVWLPQFVGRFENLQEDWKIVCKILGIEYMALNLRNPSKHDQYQAYYTESTQNLVAEYFAEEIEVFDYTFADQK